MRYPFEKQKDLKDCGVCSLLMIIRYYGGGVSKEYLRELTNTTKLGTTAYDIIQAANKLGFNSTGVKGNISDLDESNSPCIAHVVIKKSYQHFIVIYKVDKKKKKLLIADPNNNSLTKMSFEDFNKISTGNFILLKPIKQIQLVKNNNILKDTIINLVHNNLNIILPIVLFSLMVTLIQILLSYEFKFMLEYVIGYNSTSNIIYLFLILFLIILLKEISNLKRNKLVNRLNHKLDKTLFEKAYNHLLSLPYLYYKNRTTGEITSRIHDISSIREVISKSFVTCIIDLLLLIGSIITLLFISKELTIIVMIIILLIVISILIFEKPIESSITKAKVYASDVDSYLVESISGIETIRHQNILEYFKKRFLLKYCKYNITSYKYNNVFIILDFIKNTINTLGNLCIITIGTYLVILNKLDVSSLITFITLNSYVLNPIDNFTELVLLIKDAKVSFKRINELFEIQEEKCNCISKNTIKGNILINDLSYSYNNRDKFLKSINMNINKGDKILIYGDSGSGKSTLAKILAGDLKSSNKQILYDDKDINRYSINEIREDVCYVSSKDMLFTDSVYNNIVLDKEDSGFDDVTKMCLVDEFIEKKDLAYDFLIEEDGFNLSGGQRQRITLARAILKDANIYIFDEALNQIDIDKERIILKNIFNKYKDKTFIYISHRFNNTDLFNKKYRIEDGISYEEYI